MGHAGESNWFGGGRRGGLAVLLAVVLPAAGCLSGRSVQPAAGAPRLTLVGVQTYAYAPAPNVPRPAPQARLVLANPSNTALRIVAFEAEIDRGRVDFATLSWTGEEVYGPRRQGTFVLPLRLATISAADAALSANAPYRLAGWRITYLDQQGLRRASTFAAPAAP